MDLLKKLFTTTRANPGFSLQQAIETAFAASDTDDLRQSVLVHLQVKCRGKNSECWVLTDGKDFDRFQELCGGEKQYVDQDWIRFDGIRATYQEAFGRDGEFYDGRKDFAAVLAHMRLFQALHVWFDQGHYNIIENAVQHAESFNERRQQQQLCENGSSKCQKTETEPAAVEADVQK